AGAHAAGAAGGDPGGAGGPAAGVVWGRQHAHLYVRRAGGRTHRHRRPAAAAGRAGRGLPRPAVERELARGHLREPGAGAPRMSTFAGLNLHAVRAIYRFEMARTFRTLFESIASPVLSTSLYFIVFGAAIGSRMGE